MSAGGAARHIMRRTSTLLHQRLPRRLLKRAAGSEFLRKVGQTRPQEPQDDPACHFASGETRTEDDRRWDWKNWISNWPIQTSSERTGESILTGGGT